MFGSVVYGPFHPKPKRLSSNNLMYSCPEKVKSTTKNTGGEDRQQVSPAAQTRRCRRGKKIYIQAFNKNNNYYNHDKVGAFILINSLCNLIRVIARASTHSSTYVYEKRHFNCILRPTRNLYMQGCIFDGCRLSHLPQEVQLHSLVKFV